MRRHVASAQRDHAVEMLLTGIFTIEEMAAATSISARSARMYRQNLRLLFLALIGASPLRLSTLSLRFAPLTFHVSERDGVAIMESILDMSVLRTLLVNV